LLLIHSYIGPYFNALLFLFSAEKKSNVVTQTRQKEMTDSRWYFAKKFAEVVATLERAL
jgi:hypothetical protein